MEQRRPKPLLCRLNLRHRWRRRSTEDGNRWTECARCGKDKDTGGPDVMIMFH